MAEGDSEMTADKTDQVLDVLVRLAALDLDARVPPAQGREPIELVGEGLNMLAEELAAVVAEEQQLRESLESQVQERTAQLTRELEERKRAEQVIKKQAEAILELSTPVFEAWDDVLILPLIGTIDTARAQQIISQLLDSISSTRATVAILDVTGVPVVDTRVANHLIKSIEAARMLGAETILTGVSPHNAQTLVKMGIDLSNVITKSSLKAGLKWASRQNGGIRPALSRNA